MLLCCLQGLFNVARRFFLLFQQHTTPVHLPKAPGEFLEHDEGFHSVRFMGPQVALLVIDMRSARTKKDILPEVRTRIQGVYFAPNISTVSLV